MRRGPIIAITALTLTTAVGCNGGTISLACNHWGNVRNDIRAGILTDSEIRDKVREVRGATSDPTIERAATKLLSAITSGSEYEMTEGYTDLSDACD